MLSDEDKNNMSWDENEIIFSSTQIWVSNDCEIESPSYSTLTSHSQSNIIQSTSEPHCSDEKLDPPEILFGYDNLQGENKENDVHRITSYFNETERNSNKVNLDVNDNHESIIPSAGKLFEPDEETSSTDLGTRQKRTKKFLNNISKKKRLTGRAYTTTKGVNKLPKTMKNGCNDCKLKCNERITDDKRKEFFETFWAIENVDHKREFLSRHTLQISSKKMVRTRTQIDRKPNNHYFISTINHFKVEERHRVCKLMFLDTLGIIV